MTNLTIDTPARSSRPTRTVHYPDSDGKPMAESDLHRDEILYCVSALTLRYQDREDVYVSGNNYIFYEEGNPRARVSPDTYVVFGVPNRKRTSYKTWEEGGRLPSIVFEITSRSTRREDQERKIPLYQSLGIQEYWLHDPTGDYLRPALQGFRLENGVYQEIQDTGHSGPWSDVLQLFVVSRWFGLRFHDPVTGRDLPSSEQLARENARLEEQMRQETARAEAAEAELERLRAELERLKGKPE